MPADRFRIHPKRLRGYFVTDIFPPVLKTGLRCISIFALAAAGCAGTGPKPEPATSLPRVYELTVTPGDRQLTLEWSVNRASGQVFSGYNLYLVKPQTQGDATPYNAEPYPGDTDGDPSRETFVAEPLDNGVTYTCFVRAVGTDGEMGPPTALVEGICRPGGEGNLQPIYSGDYDGFDLATGRYVSTDHDDCDVAFFHKDGKDILISPSEIPSAVTMEWIFLA